jgi:hypothetical protein
MWADCVARAFTGFDDPAYGLPVCDGDMLAFTSGWLAEHQP